MTVMSCAEVLCLSCRVLFHLCLRGYASDWGHGIREAEFLTITDKEYRLKFLCNVNTLFVSCYFKNAVEPTAISRETKDSSLTMTTKTMSKRQASCPTFTLGAALLFIVHEAIGLFILDCYFLVNFQTTQLHLPMHSTLCSTKRGNIEASIYLFIF